MRVASPKLLSALGALALLATGAHAQDRFIRGDVNSDREITLVDLSAFAAAFRNGGAGITCEDAANFDDDRLIVFQPSENRPVADFDLLRGFLLSQSPVFSQDPSGPRPEPPFPQPGFDDDDEPFTCADGDARAPAIVDRRFEVRWEATGDIARGESVEFFYTVTTGAPVDAFGVAYEVNLDVLEITSIDFTDTVLSANEAGFVAGGFRPSDRPGFTLLLLATVFVDLQAQTIDNALTRGAVHRAPILRLVATIKDDAPEGSQELFAPFLRDYALPARDLTGLRNDFAAGEIEFRLDEEDERQTIGFVADPGKFFFVRGDANGDRRLDISDAVYGLEYLFAGGRSPTSPDASDADDSGVLDISDPVFLLGFLFGGSRPPPNPYPGCGVDLTIDGLPSGFYPCEF